MRGEKREMRTTRVKYSKGRGWDVERGKRRESDGDSERDPGRDLNKREESREECHR